MRIAQPLRFRSALGLLAALGSLLGVGAQPVFAQTASNTASVAAPAGTTDPAPGNNSAVDSDTVVFLADLAITKTNGASTVDAGGTTTYTLTVTNNGPSAVTGAILRDAAASGLAKTAIACSSAPGQCTAGTTPTIAQIEDAGGYALPALASGESYQITVTADVTATSGSVTNIATIAAPAGTTDPTTANDSAADADTVTPKPILTLVKQVVNTGGGTQTADAWTLTATGPTTISGLTGSAAVTGVTVDPGNYVLSESGPAGYTATQYSCSFNGTAPVLATSLTLNNGNTVVCTITNTFQPAPVLTVTKTATPPASLTAGEAISYSFLVENTGNVTLTGVVINDPRLDAAAVCVATTLAPSATTTCSGQHTIT